MIDGKKFSMNPQVGRMKAKSAIAAPKSADGVDDKAQPNSEPAHSHTITRSKDGKYHSATQHADGHVENADHASYDEAAKHGEQPMSGGAPAADDNDGDEHGIAGASDY